MGPLKGCRAETEFFPDLGPAPMGVSLPKPPYKPIKSKLDGRKKILPKTWKFYIIRYMLSVALKYYFGRPAVLVDDHKCFVVPIDFSSAERTSELFGKHLHIFAVLRYFIKCNLYTPSYLFTSRIHFWIKYSFDVLFMEH